MTKKNELVTAEKFNLTVLDGEISAAISEELDGLGPIPFDKVKIPSGGGLAFEIPGEDEDNPDTVNEIAGVILYHYPVNAYWDEIYNGSNTPPNCASLDGKRGVRADTGEVCNCAECEFNQYGSGENGVGKACKNTHRCYVLREGNPIPLLLTLPPTSLKGLRDFIGKKVLLKGLRSYDVLSKITLKKDKSSGGITYSKAVFSFVDELSPEQRIRTKKMAEMLKTMVQPDVTTDDYNVENPAVPAEKPDAVVEAVSETAEELPPQFVEV